MIPFPRIASIRRKIWEQGTRIDERSSSRLSKVWSTSVRKQRNTGRPTDLFRSTGQPGNVERRPWNWRVSMWNGRKSYTQALCQKFPTPRKLGRGREDGRYFVHREMGGCCCCCSSSWWSFCLYFSVEHCFWGGSLAKFPDSCQLSCNYPRCTSWINSVELFSLLWKKIPRR